MDEFEYHTTDPDEFDGPDENNRATGQRQRRANDFDAEARQMVAEINVIWTKGEQLVAKDNLKVTREGTKRRLNRKMALSKAIQKKVAAMNAASQSVVVEEAEVKCADTIWRRHARRNSIFHKE
eukprot:scaffold27165_cov35-Cyclotella_meneghiniana.AAC.3